MKYWIFLNHQLQGPYDKKSLCELPEFRPELQVCPEGEDVWQPAKLYPDLIPPVIQTGDYKSAGPVTSRNVEHWKVAIVPSNVEEKKRIPRPAAAAAAP